MWATGTKTKLIGVQVANNRKAEKWGQVLVFSMVGTEKEANNLV